MGTAVPKLSKDVVDYIFTFLEPCERLRLGRATPTRHGGYIWMVGLRWRECGLHFNMDCPRGVVHVDDVHGRRRYFTGTYAAAVAWLEAFFAGGGKPIPGMGLAFDYTFGELVNHVRGAPADARRSDVWCFVMSAGHGWANDRTKVSSGPELPKALPVYFSKFIVRYVC